MTKPIVIDSNILIALIDKRDKWHAQAKAIYSALKTHQAQFVYFDCVVNETVGVLARRSEEQKRSNQYSSLLDDLLQQVPKSEIMWVSAETQRLFDDTINLIRQTGGVFNFHDALIALLCRELGIQALVSFDEDFDRLSWLTRVATVDAVQQALAPPTP